MITKIQYVGNYTDHYLISSINYFKEQGEIVWKEEIWKKKIHKFRDINASLVTLGLLQPYKLYICEAIIDVSIWICSNWLL